MGNMECIVFHAAELFGQNARFSRTEPCRSPTPTSPRPRLVRDATFLEADRREIALRRGSHNRLGFAYQVAFVRVLGRFPQQTPLEIDGEILRFAALQLGADAETIHAYASRQQTVSEHQQRIGEYLRLRVFDAAAGERLARFLEDEALRLERTASLLARARAWLRDEHVLAPSDPVLRRAIGAARHKARTLLTQRMAERLSAPMREGLDALVAVDDDQPHSPLNRIKASSSNPSVGGMKRLLARLELIQTGNLAIDGAKNFGRFEAFFLPAARWEQVREAFWARTGFPVDPAAAVEQLKARLSDAFDRFLEGVADNRQVAFDDDGWRLKTDSAEHLDPAQSDSLAELHRWLDARSRTIRLADLLIEVENALGFSVHFQQPGEKRVDPGEVCALLAAILAHGCNLGPLHHGEGCARHRLQEAQVRQRLASRRGEPARRARRHRPWHLPPRRRRPLGRRHDVGQRRAALRHAAQGAAADL